MNKYEIFALISLAVSFISLAFCAFGLGYMIKNQDITDNLLRMFRRRLMGGGKRGK